MTIRTLIGDCRSILPTLPAESVHCVATSPPYWGLRDYGIAGQIGLEPTIGAYVAEMVGVFREVRRVLRKDGTLWLNLGDTYSSGGRTSRDTSSFNKGNVGAAQPFRGDDGLKPKDLCGIPWRVAFALQADGWWLRQDIIWYKTHPMPESVTDRCTKAHEYVFLLSKSARYYYDAEAIKEPLVRHSRKGIRVTAKGNDALGKVKSDNWNSSVGIVKPKIWSDGETGCNKRSVWEVFSTSFPEAHFATFPPALVEPCIKAGCPKGGTVLDPFGGAGTTGLVADRLQRNAILIELNEKYAAMADRRMYDDAPLLYNAGE